MAHYTDWKKMVAGLCRPPAHPARVGGAGAFFLAALDKMTYDRLL